MRQAKASQYRSNSSLGAFMMNIEPEMEARVVQHTQIEWFLHCTTVAYNVE